jgi:hypothetical protein
MTAPRKSAEWNLLFRELPRAQRELARAWWALQCSLLPAALVIATGSLVAAVLGIADFGWWFDTAARRPAVVDSLERKMPPFGALPSGAGSAGELPRREIRAELVTGDGLPGG